MLFFEEEIGVPDPAASFAAVICEAESAAAIQK
jgi:hypothetical protein